MPDLAPRHESSNSPRTAGPAVAETAPAARRWRRAFAAGMTGACLLAGMLPNASQAARYQLSYGNPQISDTATAIPRRASHASSDASAALDEQCYALPGRALARVGMNVTSFGSDGARAYAAAEDFVITGPSGALTVDATVRFSLHVDLRHSGAAPDNSTRAHADYFFETESGETFDFAEGSATSGNGSSFGAGALASYAGGRADVPVSLATTLPVGTPFTVQLVVVAGCEANDPAHTESLVAAELGDAAGHVMDLPAGFTVNSASWGVVDNVSTGAVAGIPGPDGSSLAFGVPAPNPSDGDVVLAFQLPREGEANVAVVDLHGRVVRALASGRHGAGLHRVVWDGRDGAGHAVAPGLYFTRLEFEGRTRVGRLTRLR